MQLDVTVPDPEVHGEGDYVPFTKEERLKRLRKELRTVRHTIANAKERQNNLENTLQELLNEQTKAKECSDGNPV